MNTVDIDDSVDGVDVVVKSDNAVKSPIIQKGRNKFYLSKSSYKYMLLASVVAFGTYFALDNKDVVSKVNVIAENSKINAILKSTYNLSIEDLADIETAAGEEEVDALLDWEDAPKSEVAPAAPVQNKNAPSTAVQIPLNAASVPETAKAISGIIKDASTPEAMNSTKSMINAAVQGDTNKMLNMANQQIQKMPQGTIQQIMDKSPVPVSADMGKEYLNRIVNLEAKVASISGSNGANAKNDQILSQLSVIANELSALKGQVQVFSAKVIELDDKLKEYDKAKEEKVEAKQNKAKPATVKQVKKKSSSWTLKSAKDGMAWISKKGSSEIVSVAVGDDIEGIGTVQEIGQNGNGTWYVKGSSGSVNE